MLQYAAYRLVIREDFSMLHHSQKLFLQWIDWIGGGDWWKPGPDLDCRAIGGGGNVIPAAINLLLVLLVRIPFLLCLNVTIKK